jgi:hypothetical protein
MVACRSVVGTTMSTLPPQDDQQFKRFVKQVENDLLDLTRALKTRLYSVSAIKRRLARNPEVDDPIVRQVDQIEEVIKLLAKVFNLKYNLADVKPFFAFLRKKMNPPRQTLITDWFKALSSPNANQ